MSAINRNALPALTGQHNKLAKSSPASSGLIPAGETSFVAELATVSNHSDLDYEMQGATQIIDGGIDVDIVMADAPDIEVEELGVPELDSAEVPLAVEDPDTAMENGPLAELEVKLHVCELHEDDIIIDYS